MESQAVTIDNLNAMLKSAEYQSLGGNLQYGQQMQMHKGNLSVNDFITKI